MFPIPQLNKINKKQIKKEIGFSSPVSAGSEMDVINFGSQQLYV